MRRLFSKYRILLPLVSLALLLVATFYMQPRTMSYFGVNLLFNLAVPIALATIAQMCIMMVEDIDLSVGAFVSLAACVTATLLNDQPALGVAVLASLVAAYAVMGAVIHRLELPAIVVTLGMSFVWGGLALFILPTPGGASPGWLRSLMTSTPPMVPMAVVASVVISRGGASADNPVRYRHCAARCWGQCAFGCARGLAGDPAEGAGLWVGGTVRRSGGHGTGRADNFG